VANARKLNEGDIKWIEVRRRPEWKQKWENETRMCTGVAYPLGAAKWRGIEQEPRESVQCWREGMG
jgi:hypothetical protein